MDKWDPAIGDKFNSEIEVSNRRHVIDMRLTIDTPLTGRIDKPLTIQGVEIRGIRQN